jgi:hypothetical protein
MMLELLAESALRSIVLGAAYGLASNCWTRAVQSWK